MDQTGDVLGDGAPARTRDRVVTMPSAPVDLDAPDTLARNRSAFAPSAGTPPAAAISAQRADGLPQVGRYPGLSSSSEAPAAIDLAVFFEPVRWMRWRLSVRRLGPYAPAYDGTPHRAGPTAVRLGFALCVVVILFAVAFARAR